VNFSFGPLLAILLSPIKIAYCKYKNQPIKRSRPSKP
jgi:hypothetical protein